MRITIPLKWEPSDSRDVAGYKVRWGRRGKTASAVTVARDCTALLLSLSVIRKSLYQVSVASYDVAGNESAQVILTSVYVG